MTTSERRKKAAEEREFLKQKLEENRFDNLMLDEISKKLSRQNELLVSIKNNVQFFFWNIMIGIAVWVIILANA